MLEFDDRKIVLTHDMIVEGVHFLAHDPAADVAWKLVAVNMSDLAAKGAKPLAALLGYTLGSSDWDRAFSEGLERALAHFNLPLLGGDTVSVPPGYLRSLGMTAIGESEYAPSRLGAKAGDSIWVSGFIGDAYAGLSIDKGRLFGAQALRDTYRRPNPRLDLGQAVAPYVNAMMDVSDGLLLDLLRMAAGSRIAAIVDLDQVPLSADFKEALGNDRDSRLLAATGGDDYELLFTVPADKEHMVQTAAEGTGVPVTRIGAFKSGSGLSIHDAIGNVPLPRRLGYEHG